MPDEANGTSTTAATSSQDQREYTAEVRFGVVMYGGVSLAIYINGVTNEIFEMACATPRDGVFIDEEGEPFTRGIYRRLSWLAGNAELRGSYAAAIRDAQARAGGADPDDAWSRVDTGGYTQTRFAVDVVAGTSAGGINGLFLAKALANGEQFSPLKDLWINEGDIALLLNDEKSILDVEPRIVAQAQPASLLNSDRMYAKLHYALGKMAPLDHVRFDPGVRGTSPLVDEIDLFITTTDIKGSPVALRLFDKVVYERRFKQNYHFTYPNGITPGSDDAQAKNDFGVENRAFLAFAARCTSSFPFAFEPMTLDTLTRLKVAGTDPGVLRWNAFFPNLPRSEVDAGKHVSRAFGDGGYLDNKPFSYVVETLSHRFSAVPMERKLLYVEPSPEHIDPDAPGIEPDPERKPDPLQNSLAALTSIPQYETIREDLQAVLVRNRRIERIERVVRLGELSVKLFDPFMIEVRDRRTVPDWSSLKLSDMVKYYGTAFLPYQRLRVYALTDAMADRLGDGLQIGGDSDKQYALRAMVRVWRERNFHDEGQDDKPTINAFLDQFDLDYRLRRIAFTLRKIDKLTRLFHKFAAAAPAMAGDADAPPEFSEEERQILESLPEWYVKPGESLTRERAASGEQALRVLKKGLLEIRERLQQVARGVDLAPPPGPEGDAIRKELDTVLMEILGRATPGKGAEIRAASGTTPIVLDPQAARMASASRTLQESVVFRAQAIFHAADQVAETPIQRWLLGSIDAMRIKGAGSALLAERHDVEAASNAAWELLGTPTLIVETVAPTEGVVADATTETRKVVVNVGDALADGLAAIDGDALAAVNAADGLLIRKYLSLYYLRFDTYDQMSFPLYYDTGTGEPSTVEVVRISPIDATNLIDESAGTRKKLAGTALANFGAFLDRRWRLNDIMWGQLDGAERLIQALLPMTDDDTRVVRKELIERAQRCILRDALVPEGEANLTSLVVNALDAAPGSGTTDEQLKKLFADLWTGNAAAQASMGTVLASLLSEPKLMDFVRNTRKTDPQPDPEMTLRSAARAVTITGRVLQVISKQHNAGEMPSRWIARLGLALQGVVAVSLPGTLNQRWWTHGMKLLYGFEVVLVLLAFVFGSADMRTLAITALASTFGVHLLTLITGDLTRGRNRVLHLATMAVLAAVVVLALIGGLVVFHQGAQQQLCWAHPADGTRDGPATWVCDRTAWVHRTWSSIWNRGGTP